MKHLFISLFLLMICGTVDAQDKKIKKKIQECLKVGDYYANLNHWDMALAYYQQAHIYDIKDTDVILRIAETYRTLRKYPQAEEWYLNLTLTTDVPYPLSLFWIGKMLQNKGRYVEAKRAFQDFEMSYPFNDSYRARTDLELQNCNKAMLLKSSPVSARVMRWNKLEKNMGFSDFKLMGASLYLKEISLDKVDPNHKRPKTKLIDPIAMDSLRYESVIKSKIDSLDEEELAYIDLNLEFPGELSSFPTRLDNRVIAGFKVKGWEVFYETYYEDGVWSDWVKIEGLDDKNTQYKDPQLVKEWKEVHLYYAYKNNGNKGGYDIAACVLNGSKKGAEIDLPENMNSMFDERYPFYDGDRNSLYFSSEGLAGLGGYDNYKIQGRPGADWSKIKNLGYPINTSFDDFSYNVISEHKALFSSNRTDKMYDTSFDNIYEVDFSQRTSYVKLNLNDKFEDVIDEYNWEIASYKLYLCDDTFNTVGEVSDSTSPTFILDIDAKYKVSVEVGGYEKPFEFQIQPKFKSLTSMQDSMSFYFILNEEEFLTEIPVGMLIVKKDTLINEVKLNETINPSEKVSNKDIKYNKEENSSSITLVDLADEEVKKPRGTEITPIAEKDKKDVKKDADSEISLKSKAKEKNVFYKVQLGVFSKDRKDYFKKEVRLVAVTEERVGKFYKYYFGKWYSFSEAQAACKEVKESLLSDAFIVAFQDDKRISLAKAKEILGL